MEICRQMENDFFFRRRERMNQYERNKWKPNGRKDCTRNEEIGRCCTFLSVGENCIVGSRSSPFLPHRFESHESSSNDTCVNCCCGCNWLPVVAAVPVLESVWQSDGVLRLIELPICRKPRGENFEYRDEVTASLNSQAKHFSDLHFCSCVCVWECVFLCLARIGFARRSFAHIFQFSRENREQKFTVETYIGFRWV